MKKKKARHGENMQRNHAVHDKAGIVSPCVGTRVRSRRTLLLYMIYAVRKAAQTDTAVRKTRCLGL